MSEQTKAMEELLKEVEGILDQYHMDVDYQMEDASAAIIEAFITYKEAVL